MRTDFRPGWGNPDVMLQSNSSPKSCWSSTYSLGMWAVMVLNFALSQGMGWDWYGQNQCSQVTWETINSQVSLSQLKLYIVFQWQKHKYVLWVNGCMRDYHTHNEGGGGKKRKMHLRSYLCLMLKSLNAQTIIYHYRSTGGQYNALELCTMTQFSIKIFLQCRVLRNC